jgi:HlyD family secretion protein
MKQELPDPAENPQLEAEDVYLRSEELQEVLGRAPGWVVRSGIFMIALFFTLIMVAAYFIRSYDMVPCPVKITTQTLPATVEARQSGKISHLFVDENQQVTAQEHLAVIQSTCAYEDLLKIQSWLSAFEQKLAQGTVGQPYPTVVDLGVLEPPFTQLQNAIDAYHFFAENAFLLQKQQQLRTQIKTQKALLNTASRKEELARDVLALSEQNRKGERSLFEDQVISQKANNEAEKDLIKERLQVANLEQEQVLIQLEIVQLQQQINELGQLHLDKNRTLLEALREALSKLTSAIEEWEDNYVLKAPIAGRVSFFQFWSANQEVNASDEVMVIIPAEQALLAYAYLPVANAGKVAPGQRARLELADFPAQEFGYVWGDVLSKSEIARDGAYLLKINLADGLKTRQDEPLRFSQEMTGIAQIIVRDENLLQRLFRTLHNGYDRMMERTKEL